MKRLLNICKKNNKICFSSIEIVIEIGRRPNAVNENENNENSQINKFKIFAY